MSGRGGPANRQPARVQAPLLDRLMDDALDQERDPAVSATDSMVALRNSVRRDLEALLNARRCWRSWPAHMTQLATSPIGYGMPDFASGAFSDAHRREELRQEIEGTIRRFEPRFLSLRVNLVEAPDRLDTTLRLRIEAVMHAEPAPEFDHFRHAGRSDQRRHRGAARQCCLKQVSHGEARASVESRRGAVLQQCSPSPLPAHRTGRADFPHPALRLASWQAHDVASVLRHMRGRSTPSVPNTVSMRICRLPRVGSLWRRARKLRTWSYRCASIIRSVA